VAEHFFATSPRGLEALLCAELAALGAQDVTQSPGGVAFSGDWAVCYAANLWSRLASRVLWRVAEFGYASGPTSTRPRARWTGRATSTSSARCA
jgi:putative N6-adenine-specific DNA methylase